jgi:hypothetical protein
MAGYWEGIAGFGGVGMAVVALVGEGDEVTALLPGGVTICTGAGA